jgi:hypothetical protein
VRSRVMGAFDAVLHSGLAVSFAVAGPAVDWLGPRGVYVLGGIVTLVGVGVALPILREREPQPRPLAEAVSEADGPSLLVP